MSTLLAQRKNNAVANGLLFLIAFTFLTTWLPFLRALFDGESYVWGTTYFGATFGGSGLSPAYLVLVVQVAFFALLFASIYWLRNRALVPVLLGVWWIHIFGNLLFDIIRNGDTMFHGDTLNVHISLTAIILPLSVLALALIVIVIRGDRSDANTALSWSGRNRIMALLIFGPLPLQAVLFATGNPHGTGDQVAVLISILQCMLIPLVVRPYRLRSSEDRQTSMERNLA